MAIRLLVDGSLPGETRLAVLDGNRLVDYQAEVEESRPRRSNIYLAKVVRVEPSLQAAFVEYGGNRHGFLPFSEIHPDYYRIPVSDREELLAEEAEDGTPEEEEDGGGRGQRSRGRGRGRRAAARRPVARRARRSHGLDEGGEEGEEEHEEVREALGEEMERGEEHEEERGEEGAEEGEGALEAAAEEPGEEDARSGETSENEGEDEEGLEAAAESDEDGEEEDEEEGDEDDGDEEGSGRASSSVENRLEAAREARLRRRALRRYRIQEVVSPGQVMLVQVIRDEHRGKGAAMTSYISLAGRYCVLMPNSETHGGVSRRVDGAARRKMQSIMEHLDLPEGMSLILRTAGSERSRTEIVRDFEQLLATWEEIRTITLASAAPVEIYEDGSLLRRTVRDVYANDVEEIVVSGKDAWENVRRHMRHFVPSHVRKVRLWENERSSVFAHYKVEAALSALHNPRVRLPSGGEIVIAQTEALVSVDVNSGRSTRERNIERTAFKTNLEAAAEVARQMKIRDLAGLIVIDFIDMDANSHIREVERTLRDAVQSDRARIQLGRISQFGLLELSRQRLRLSFAETTTDACPACHGTGRVLGAGTAASQAIHALLRRLARGGAGEYRLSVSPDVAAHILNRRRRLLLDLEEEHGASIAVIADPRLAQNEQTVEASGAGGGQGRARRQSASQRNHGLEEAEDSASEGGEPDRADEDGEERRGRGRRRGRRGGRRHRGQRSAGEDRLENNELDNEAGDEPGGALEEEEAPEAESRGRTGRRRTSRARSSGANGEDATDDDGKALDGEEGEEGGTGRGRARRAPARAKSAAKPRRVMRRSRKTAAESEEEAGVEGKEDKKSRPARSPRPKSSPKSSTKRSAEGSATDGATDGDGEAGKAASSESSEGSERSRIGLGEEHRDGGRDLAAEASGAAEALAAEDGARPKRRGWWN